MRIPLLASALVLGLVACAAPDHDTPDEPGASADAITTGNGRDIQCTTTIQGSSRVVHLELGAVGGGGRARMVEPSLRTTALDAATQRDGDGVRVTLSGPGGADVATLRLPATLWNDPGRGATNQGTPIFREPWFDADLVSVTGPSWTRPRCELDYVPSAPGISSDLQIVGTDAERLFDAMKVPLQASPTNDRRTEGRRPFGAKVVEGPGLWRLECSNRGPQFAPFPGVDDVESTTCDFKLRAHVAERTPTMTTYRMSLTEREKAGRLLLAFEDSPIGDRVGFEVRGLEASGARGRGPVPGSRLRVACKDEGELRTTCDVELAIATAPW